MSFETKIQAILTLIVVGVAIVHMVILIHEDRRRQIQAKISPNPHPLADRELVNAIDILYRGLEWYCDGDNHPSSRVARESLNEFRAAIERINERRKVRG